MHQNFEEHEDETTELDFEKPRPFTFDELSGTDDPDADDVYYDPVCGVFKVKGG